MRDEGLDYAALEVSSHALDQHRVDGTWFVAACFTNLTQDHLDYHGSMEEYFEAKASLFDPTTASRTAAVNVDDRNGRELERRALAAGLPVVTLRALRRSAEPDRRSSTPTPSSSDRAGAGSRSSPPQRHAGAGRHPVLGRLNVANAVAAAATALAAGFPLRTVADGLERPVEIPGRLERIEAGQPFTVLVDYAHTPDGLERLFEVARSRTAGEAGGLRRVRLRRRPRPRQARRRWVGSPASGADMVIVTSDNPRTEDPQTIAASVLTVCATRPGPLRSSSSTVARRSRRRATRPSPGDVVVIAGKGHETGQTTGDRTLPFDDRVVAREELAEAAG